MKRPVCRGCFTLSYAYGLRVTEAVKELCAKKRHLGGLPGILSVLHTWNGQLGYHPHVHMLITGGGISPDGRHWEPGRNEYLLPVAVLSKKIAAKFRDAVKEERPDVFRTIPAHVWKREWVSFIKHYGHGNDAVLNYLSRYVLRIAISNARILAVDETHVTFRWKDRSADTWRTTRLEGVEFLRRFLQHVLPRGFHSAASLRSAATTIIERSSESPSRQTKTMCCFPEAKKLATEERHHTSPRGV